MKYYHQLAVTLVAVQVAKAGLHRKKKRPKEIEAGEK